MPSSNCLLRHTGTRLWFCKLFRKPEMILKRVTVLLFIRGGWLIVGNFKGWIEAPNSLWVLPPVSLGVGEGGRNSYAASCKISRISKHFKEASSNFKSTFRYIEDAKNLKPSAHKQKVYFLYMRRWFLYTDMIFKAFKKLFISWHCPFNSCKYLRPT